MSDTSPQEAMKLFEALLKGGQPTLMIEGELAEVGDGD
jgi:hypothetical protein